MKKILILIGVIGLSGCTYDVMGGIEDFFDNCDRGCRKLEKDENIAKDLEEQRNAHTAYLTYKNLCCDTEKGMIYAYSYGSGCIYPDAFVDKNTHVKCWFSDYGYSGFDADVYYSDECVSERQNNPNSDICFFDYKRFLPNDTWIQTKSDFKAFIDYLNEANYSENASDGCTLNKVDYNKYRTQQEIAAYQKEQYDSFAHCVATSQEIPKQINRQKELEKQEQKEKELKLAEQKKRYEEIKECEYKASKDGKRELGWFKVYHIAPKGVIVSCYDCNSTLFIYTDKKYANGDYIDDAYYYETAGMYEYKTTDGAIKRLHAYKETTSPVCRKR